MIRDNHFEADTVDHTFIRLSNAKAVDILRNYMLLAGLRLEASTSSVKVARNRFFTDGNPTAGEVDDQNAAGNQVVSSGPEANLYVNNTVAFAP